MTKNLIPVLIAGIGGASLGTELLKSLVKAGRYKIFGVDISEYAYGHYQTEFVKTFVIKRENYKKTILNLCLKNNIKVIIPGGEEPNILLGRALNWFKKKGIHVATNSPEVIRICSNKNKLFEILRSVGVRIPQTLHIRKMNEFSTFSYPCIIKPARGSGGSSFVFIANKKEEAKTYIKFLLNNKKDVLIQEYIPLSQGEFTVGVLSDLDGSLIGSIALRRIFNSKLSTSLKTKTGLISSGYSQGMIDEFPIVRKKAEEIAKKIGSKGPLNIQGRMQDGDFIPFEVNPRFSATTFLRCLAGFNEVDFYLQRILFGNSVRIKPIKKGWYLRSLTELYVSGRDIKNDKLDNK